MFELATLKDLLVFESLRFYSSLHLNDGQIDSMTNIMT